MIPEYFTAATLAAALERHGDFVEAKVNWIKAGKVAGPLNEEYCELRRQFCDNAANRGWGSQFRMPTADSEVAA